jgi:hypothetical protein
MPQNNNPKQYLEQKQDLLIRRLDEIRSELAASDPELLSLNTGTHYEPDLFEFMIELWGDPVQLSYPAFKAQYIQEKKELTTVNLALLLYYFYCADGTRKTEDWISFSELPDGKFYQQAFNGYTGDEIKKYYEHDLERLKNKALQIGGRACNFADLSYRFDVLPRVSLSIAIWIGDEELPGSFQVLFNSSVSHYLPTDACAIAGSIITRKLLYS